MKFAGIWKTLLLVGIIAPAASVIANNDVFSTRSGTTIAFEKYDKQYYRALRHLKQVDNLVCHYLRNYSHSQTIPCHIHVMQKAVKGGINVLKVGNGINIYLGGDFDKWRHNYEIHRTLMTTLLLAKSKISPESHTKCIPEWLTAGMFRELLNRRGSQSILPVRSYPGLKALCLAGKTPDFRASLEQPLYPDQDGTAWELYSELCLLMLDTMHRLASNNDNVIADMVILAANGKYSSDEIFDATAGRIIRKYYHQKLRSIYGKNTSEDEQLQKCLEHLAKQRFFNFYNPLPAAVAAKKFKQFRVLKYKKGPKGRQREYTVDITDLPRLFVELPEIKIQAAEKSLEIAGLINTAPPLARTPLQLIAAAVSQLDTVPPPVLRQRFSKACDQANKALERQQKIEHLLVEIEQKNVPPAQLYRREIKEIKREHVDFWPNMTRFLDKTEKSFMED